ncbi:glycosyltransferase [Leptolyngbya sp. BC1307]|uniref:glycosyltransferase n=1 Tax=Leptolyngbya sp. BC1307 TaxID=2029589 RepID=UPI000EFC7B33|nr:glycosyltransferase [Leptolyngbya sp. BC1307]
MRYPILNIELSEPLPDLTTDERDTGLALVLRYGDRPIGFILHSMQPDQPLSGAALGDLLSQQIGAKLLEEKIHQELTISVSADAFPTLTVAICTKDRPDNVKRCLTSLLALQRPDPEQPVKFEILVVDNAPSDERTRHLVDLMPTVSYTCEPKPGLDFARNHALHAATGELLAFLDDDVVVDRCWLKGLQEARAENPDAAAFTGLVLPYELETEAQIVFERRGGFRRGFEKIRYGQSLPGNPCYPCGAGIFGAGCNMTFQRRILLEIGGFDEALDTGKPLPGGGDLDIFYRVIRAGYSLVYEPTYLIYHQHRQTMEQLQHQYWTWGLGFMAFTVKSFHHDPAYRRQIFELIAWWFRYQAWELLQSFGNQSVLSPRMALSELWGGVVGLCGEYPRSLRRIEKIRTQYSQSSPIRM